jgi:hypothetical protein
MADQAELVFVRSFIKLIGAQPIVYSDDYHQPPQNSLKKVPILPVRVQRVQRVHGTFLRKTFRSSFHLFRNVKGSLPHPLVNVILSALLIVI